MNRAVWISDGSYLFKSALGRFDYLKLKKELEEASGSPIAESYYFNSRGSGVNTAQDSFYKWMKSAPPIGPQMIVKLYSLKQVRNTCTQCGAESERDIQKGVDVGIATMIMRLSAQNRFDQLILTAGDGDLADAVEYVKQVGKQISLAGFKDSVSPDLQCYADRMIWLDEMWERIRKAPREGFEPSEGGQ